MSRLFVWMAKYDLETENSSIVEPIHGDDEHHNA